VIKLIVFGLAFLTMAGAVAAQNPVGTMTEKVQLEGQPVKIARDAYGVPRIFAASLQSLFAGDGYAVAEDRAWQLEIYRLDAEGRLAEVFGSRFVERDEEVRRDGLTGEELQQEFSQLPRRDQRILEAYAAGVSGYLRHAESTHSLPPEFTRYAVHPEPWSVVDSMAIMAMMSRRFGGSGVDQLQNEEVIRYLTRRLGKPKAMEVFNDLAWENDPAAIPTIAATDISAVGNRQAEAARPSPAESGQLAEIGDNATYSRSSFLNRLNDEMSSAAVFAAARQLGLATRWGSYTWVISPKKSVSGHAILLGGPQMGFTTPQIAHEIQLTGAGFEVIGMDFAGIPGVLIGSNTHLAWTSTSGESHNEDVFVEKLRPGDPYEYFYRGAWRPMEHRVERILVKG